MMRRMTLGTWAEEDGACCEGERPAVVKEASVLQGSSCHGWCVPVVSKLQWRFLPTRLSVLAVRDNLGVQ